MCTGLSHDKYLLLTYIPSSSMYSKKLNFILSVSAAKVMIFRGGRGSQLSPDLSLSDVHAGWLTFAPMCKKEEMKINLPLYFMYRLMYLRGTLITVN